MKAARSTAADIRVLLADDSDLFAEELRRVLEGDRHIHVVGRAVNGKEAVELTARLKPDLVVMDVLMPVMDGLAAIQKIMAFHPTPILVMTSDPRGQSGELALEATRRGALDLVMKSAAYASGPQEDALRSHVRFLARVPVVRHQDGSHRSRRPRAADLPGAGIRVIGIVASTGGPAALATVMQDLPPGLKAGIALVQHLPAGGFVDSLAEWLANVCTFDVRVARAGDVVEPGRVLVAPDNYHLLVQPEGVVALSHEPPCQGFRPAGDVLFGSLARSFGPEALGVVLTGIGSDGGEGLLALRRAGGRTLAQDGKSSLIFGMPQVAWQIGAVERLTPLAEMADAIADLVGSREVDGGDRRGGTRS